MKLIFSIAFFAVYTGAAAQIMTEAKTYVVVTISRERNWDMHGAESTYWLLDLSNQGRTFVPLYLSGSSETLFDRCCALDSVELFNTVETKFSVDAKRESGSVQLRALLEQNHLPVQAIEKRWGKKYKETIKIAITPIIGEFCICPIVKTGPQLIIGRRLAIPKGPFHFDRAFFNSVEHSDLLTHDYSDLQFIDFSSIL